MFEAIRIGCKAEKSLIVGDEHTAARVGSGGLPVFATPQMVALMETAAVAAVDPLLPQGYQTVGIHVNISHLAATPMGGKVTACAELIEIAPLVPGCRRELGNEREAVQLGKE